ncbi:MAG: hypothetical protein MUO24_05625, partial [Desulfobacterales bacterium]|nr:hypothetical protein [Desulfobacterales bacterium]
DGHNQEEKSLSGTSPLGGYQERCGRAMGITGKKIERIIIAGLLDECKKAHAYCRENGFRIMQGNPCLIDGEHRNKVKIVTEENEAQQ